MNMLQLEPRITGPLIMPNTTAPAALTRNGHLFSAARVTVLLASAGLVLLRPSNGVSLNWNADVKLVDILVELPLVLVANRIDRFPVRVPPRCSSVVWRAKFVNT